MVHNISIMTQCYRCAMLYTYVWTSHNHCAHVLADTVTHVQPATTRTTYIQQNSLQTLEERSVTSAYKAKQKCDTPLIMVTFQLVKFSSGRLEVSHLTDDGLERETKHLLTVLWLYCLIYRRPAGQLRSVFHRPKSNKWPITLTDSPYKNRACLKTYTIMNKSNIT